MKEPRRAVVPQSAKPWTWTPVRLKAAQQLAQGERVERVAAALGMSRSSIWRWKCRPEFAERLKELTEEYLGMLVRSVKQELAWRYEQMAVSSRPQPRLRRR